MKDALDIKHEENGSAGRYYADIDGDTAELTYRIRDDGAMVIVHTFTPPAARGKGVALRLTERAISDAKAQKRMIVPRCPYVARVFDERPEWAALRAAP